MTTPDDAPLPDTTWAVPLPAAPATWVMLRGLGRGSGHWGDAFMAQLQTALPQAKLLALDLPGNGTRHRERSPTRIGEMVDDARALLRRQGVTRPCGVLAMSLGAMVAAEWARRHPKELQAAVLINTSLRPFNPAWQRMRPAAAARLLGLLAGNPPDEDWERAIFELTSSGMAGGIADGIADGREGRPAGGDDPAAKRAAATLSAWLHLRRTQPVARLNLLRQLLAAARHGAAPEPPAVPLLLLAGSRDALVDPRCSRELSRRWQARLVEHPSAGHDLPLEDGAWVARQVAAWLRPAG